MDKPKLMFASLLLMILAAPTFSQSTPLAAVRSFYAFDRSHSQVFNRTNIDARKRWLNDKLYNLLLKELDREREYLKQNPTDKPHFGDGLPFQPLDETCEVNGQKYRRQLQFGTVRIKESIGNVDVSFVYPKACKIEPVLFGIHLIRVKGRWLIENVLYSGDKTLIEDLERTEY
jgi:hypothetical protein